MVEFKLDYLKELSEKYNAELLLNEKLAPYTSFKIGGNCNALLKITSENCLAEAAKFCKTEQIPFYVLGKGSNVLISDKGLNGVVFLMSSIPVTVKGNVIECFAGASLASLCRAARDNSLTGLEFAYGIPGSVGGAVYMNAGAYGGEISQILKSCRFLGTDNKIRELKTEELEMTYRHSVFQDYCDGYCNNKAIILSAEFALDNGVKREITAKMDEFAKKRREKQPLEFPSAGSTFKRPEGDFAARLIDECGLKGFGQGGAAISEKHAGFVINKGGAEFNDVMMVINTVRSRVYERSGILLECEIEIWE